jgi:VCBS repeat-containing protein
MDTPNRRDRRHALRVGAATAALAATMLTGAVVSAQTPSTAPTATTAPTQTTPSVPGNGQAFGVRNGAPDQMGGRGQQGGPGQGFGGQLGGQGFGDQQGFGGPGRGDMAGMGRSAVTVTTNEGTSLGLTTADGWARTIDTANVVLTKNGATITLADIAVGDRVSIAQTRNADGSYTVTGIAVLPAMVSGTVATVGTDSFTVTLADGTTQTVNVTASTTWKVQGSTSTTPGIADLTVGRAVSATGTLAADGSLDATTVVAR